MYAISDLATFTFMHEAIKNKIRCLQESNDILGYSTSACSLKSLDLPRNYSKISSTKDIEELESFGSSLSFSNQPLEVTNALCRPSLINKRN